MAASWTKVEVVLIGVIKTSNEVVPHFFELGVGVGMFEEEIALAELEVEEGTHFGVVSEG